MNPITINVSTENDRRSFIDRLQKFPIASKPIKIKVEDLESRTLEQNSKMWPMLGDISKQVVMTNEGYMSQDEAIGKDYFVMNRLSAEEWKQVFTAILMGQKSVPNPEGSGLIILGTSTKEMSKANLSNLIELMYAFGSQHEVEWSE